MFDGGFGREVCQRRKEMGLSLRVLAQMTGISTSAISRIENGVFNPTLDNAVKLAGALGLSLASAGGLPSSEEEVTLQVKEKDKVSVRERPIVEYRAFAVTSLRAGIRRNLSKIAASGGYDRAILLSGTFQLRSINGYRENLKPGAVISCQELTHNTYFAIPAQRAELLWIG